MYRLREITTGCCRDGLDGSRESHWGKLLGMLYGDTQRHLDLDLRLLYKTLVSHKEMPSRQMSNFRSLQHPKELH